MKSTKPFATPGSILVTSVQILLSASLLWAASMKLLKSPDELGQMWPWTASHPVLVKFTGILDLLAAIGLILPLIVPSKLHLTRYTAYAIIALMVAATVFHIARGEASSTGFNVVFALLAGFIAWRR